MKKPILLAGIALAFSHQASAQLSAPNFTWSRQISVGTSSSISIREFTADWNAVHVVGDFVGALTFDGTRLVSASGRDLFIAKWSRHGELLWAERVGWLPDEHASGIAADLYGNTFIAGRFNGSTIIGSVPIETPKTNEWFVAKFDKHGTFQWVHKGAAPLVQNISRIVADPFGDCYVTGAETQGQGNGKVLLAKISGEGQLLWLKVDSAPSGQTTLGRPSSTPGYLTATSDRVYVTLSGRDMTFAPVNLLSSGGTFLFAFSASGVALWANEIDGYGHQFVVVNDPGRVSVGSNSKIEHFTEQGARLPSLAFDQNYGWRMVVDPPGYIYSTTTTSANTNSFLSKISPTGRKLWQIVVTGATWSSDSASAPVDGACYLAGTFSGSVLLGNTRLTKQGGTDAFIVRIDPTQFQVRQAGATIAISWPVLPKAALEFSDSLAKPNWIPTPNGSTVIEDQNVIVEPATGSARFYRLRVASGAGDP